MAQRRGVKVPRPEQSSPPKVVTPDLVDLAKQAKLSGKELQDFVDEQGKKFKDLQVMHLRQNATSFGFDRSEIVAVQGVVDGMLPELVKDLAKKILKSAADAGMPPAAVEQFALKLAVLGFNQ